MTDQKLKEIWEDFPYDKTNIRGIDFSNEHLVVYIKKPDLTIRSVLDEKLSQYKTTIIVQGGK